MPNDQSPTIVKIGKTKKVAFRDFWVPFICLLGSMVTYQLMGLKAGENMTAISLQIFISLFGLLWFAGILKIIFRAMLLISHVPGAKFPPRLTIVLLCVPIFNLFWLLIVLVGFAKKWEILRQQTPELPKVNAGICAALGILLMLVPFVPNIVIWAIPVLAFICFYQICRAINSAVELAFLSRNRNFPFREA